MSFILDAIAKSERERQQQEIPDARILAMPVSNAPHSRRNLPYYIIAVLLVTVIVMLLWMQSSGRSPITDILSLKNNVVESVTGRAASSDQFDVLNKTTDIGVSDSLVAVDQAGGVSASAQQNTVSKPQSKGQEAVFPGQISVGIEDKSAPLHDDSRAVSGNSGEPILSEKIVKTSKDVNLKPAVIEADTQSGVIARLESPVQTVVETKVEPVRPEREITPLNELPSDVRRDLPSVSFTGHLYSKNVKLSYVMVGGGRSVIAGQQIADELYLYKVTPTGVIVDFRGFLIETGVLQNWSLK